jgi:secondary thiamine-phosphate synthase enzyme
MVKLTVEEVRSTKEFQMIKITDKVRVAVEKSGIKNGLVAVISAHTTTGIMINESLPCVEQDIEEALERLIPRDEPYMHAHFLPSYGTTGGNSPGHLKSMLVGNHCLLPVVDGKMHSGHAQDIYFVEFDGVKPRKYFIQVIGE